MPVPRKSRPAPLAFQHIQHPETDHEHEQQSDRHDHQPELPRLRDGLLGQLGIFKNGQLVCIRPNKQDALAWIEKQADEMDARRNWRPGVGETATNTGPLRECSGSAVQSSTRGSV